MTALKLSQSLGLFHGWIVLGGLVAVSTVSGGTGQYAFGVFLKSFMDEFHSGRAAVSATISIYFAFQALSGPFVGRLIDKYGSRRMILLGGISNAITLLLIGSATALWQVYILYAVKAASHAMLGTIGIGALVSRWFIEKKGRAMGFGVTAFGFGGLLFVPLIGYLIPLMGWRIVFLILAALLAILTAPIATLVIRNSPEEMGLFPDGKSQPGVQGERTVVQRRSAQSDVSMRQAVRTTSFWFLAVAVFLVGMSVFGTMTHQIPYLTDMGIPIQTAAVALGFTAGMGIIGKLFWGSLSDWLPVRRVAMLCFSLQAVGVIILMQTTSLAMVWVYVLVFGFAMGGLAVMQGLLVMDTFGSRNIGSILGAVAPAMSLGASLGPLAAGYLFDLQGSYTFSFTIFLVAYAVAVAAIYLAPRPRI